MKTVVAALFGLSLLLVAQPAQSQCPDNKFESLADLKEDTQVTAHVAAPSTGRVRLTFIGENGELRELVWDPAVDRSGVRTMLLPKGKWRAALSADQERLSIQNVIALRSWTRAVHETHGGVVTIKLTGSLLATTGALTTAAPTTDFGEVVATLTCRSQEKRAKLSIEKQDIAPRASAAAAPDARGFLESTVSAPIVEALSLLAEIAFERARAGALELVREKLIDPLCKQLTLDKLNLGAGAALPRTCGLLQRIDLGDLVGTGRSLLAALRDDLRFTVLPSALTAAASRVAAKAPHWKALVELGLDIVNRRLDGRSFAGTEFELALAVVDRLPWATSLKDKALEGACGVRLAVGIVKLCTHRTCTVGDIAGMVSKPQDWFATEVDKGGFAAKCWTGDAYTLPDAGQGMNKVVEMAVRALALWSSPDTADARTRLLQVTRWVLDVAQVASGDDRPKVAHALEDALVALIEEDYLRVAAAAFTIAKDLYCGVPRRKDCEVPKVLDGPLRLLGAVAAYARVDTRDLDAAEARQARKEALESLIDEATSRHNRGGDWVVSVGSTVGYSFGALQTYAPSPSLTTLDDAEKNWEFNSGLRIPLGVHVQKLPSKACAVGFHSGLWLADLGHFLRDDAGGKEETVRWDDFVGIGAQVGFLFGTPTASFVLALEASWSPGLYQRTYELTGTGEIETGARSGALQLGAIIGFYVPFFDLN